MQDPEQIPIWWLEREIEMTKHLCGCVRYSEAIERVIKNWKEEYGAYRQREIESHIDK